MATKSGSSPEKMMDAVTASMKARTGRTLEQWVALTLKSRVDPLDQKAVRNWLRTEHGLLQNSQWAIADAVATKAGWKRPSTAEYTDSQYTGKKAALRPIYDAIESVVLGLGEDVRAEGRSGYTPFVRGRQFCAVAATTSRVDLGLRFKEAPKSKRLVEGGPGQATHKVALASPAEVDSEVKRLLRAAYDQNP